MIWRDLEPDTKIEVPIGKPRFHFVEEPEQDGYVPLGELAPPQPFASAHVTPTIVSPISFQGAEIPPREWLVANWIPMGVVTSLYGDGGLGKTLIAQQLQTSAAIGRAWLGLFAERVPSLGVYCEDSQDELQRRQAEINAGYGCEFADLADVHWMPRLGEDNILIQFARGVGELTPFHRQVKEAACDLRAKLVIVDTVADLFGGNENDRGQVRQFIARALGSIAQAINGAVVACAHPSRTGLNSGEGDGGSTGWSNSVRSRLFLTTPNQEDGESLDPDLRILRRRKANYAARHDEVRLRWQNGVIVTQPASEFFTGFSRRPAEDVFLDLLDRLTGEDRPVSDNSRAANFAPRMFSKRAAPQREEYREADFKRAMEALFGSGAITNVEYGRKSDFRRKIARAES